MQKTFKIKLLFVISLILVAAFVLDKDFVINYVSVEADSDTASIGDAQMASDTDAEYRDIGEPTVATIGDAEIMDLVVPFKNSRSMVFGATAVVNKSVGNKHPMENNASWWANAKSYITSTFGVVDGQYNTVDNAPSAGSVWCAGLVSRVIYNTYPGGSKVAVTESVDTLYSEMQASGNFEFVAEGYVGDFADIVEKTKAGDIMLLMSKDSGGNWKWTHANLITWYGYIYSQGAGGKIRMNTFDNYNEYGAYDPAVSAGYYYYIYRAKSSSYLGLRKVGNLTGKSFDNVVFEAYDTSGNYLGVYITSLASSEKGGYSYYLRKSASDTSYVDGSDGSIALPVGSTVYLYEQGVKTGNGYTLPTETSGYAGTKGSTWSYVRGPQKQYYITAKTVDYDHWTASNAIRIEDPETTYGPVSLKKSTVATYSLYTQDPARYSLEGAKYTVASSDNKFVYYLETDSSGTAYLLDGNGHRTSKSTIQDIPAGTYYCWETSPSKGYKLDDNCNVNHKKSITLGANAAKSGSFTSEEVPIVNLKGGIEIIKRSSESFTDGNPNYSLEAVYTVYDSSGKEVGKINTSSTGYGYLGGLASGTYTIKETQAGKGYYLDENSYSVVVTAPAQGTYVYEGIDYSAVFNPTYYRSKYSDLAGMSDAALLQHFAKTGLNEGRRASLIYDASYYASKTGKSCFEAFKYYLGYGMYQNSQASPYDELEETEAGVYMNNSLRPAIISYEKPKTHTAGINLEKLDRFTESNVTEGESTLEGAHFKISFYAKTSEDISSIKEPVEGEEEIVADRGWVIETRKDENGRYVAYLTDDYLSTEFESDEFYIDSDGNIVIPYGVIQIEEVKASAGYKINEVIYNDQELDERFVVELNEDTFDGNVTVKDTIIRGDIKLEKRDYESDKAMAGVQFEVRSALTGEALIITTDENGFATTSGMWMKCTSDGSEVQSVETYGALPFGKYIVSELRCDANEGKQLEPPIEVMVEDEVIYDAFDPSNNERIIRNVPMPEIGTVAHVKDSERDTVPIDEEASIVDTVNYKYLRASTEYTLYAKMMLLDEDGNVKELKKDGRPVTSMTHFTTESDYQKSIFEMTGTVDVLFEPIDVSDLGGSSIVIYEYLYLGNGTDEDTEYTDYENEDIFPVKHENPKDEDQTVHVIKIGTSASEGETTDDGKATIIDKVSYSNVIKGDSYSVEGTLYDKATGEPVLINNEEVTASAEFTAESTSGAVDVTFEFDVSGLVNSDYVVFERMFDSDGRLVAKHEDIDDEEQSVTLKKTLVGAATSSTSVKTNDKYALLKVVIILMLSGAGILCNLHLKKRK